MASVDRSSIIFGCANQHDKSRSLEIGDLSFEFNAETVRAISWKGKEVVRGISWPVRDPNWITMPQESPDAEIRTDGSEIAIDLRFSVGGGALKCSLKLRTDASGSVDARLEMEAVRSFKTNRAGFTVLHPILGVAGEPLSIRHSDGSRERTEFPALISPGQPAFDIIGMEHTVSGIQVEIAFEGETFEMEDQRNWSDGSYKTYCRPLKVPFTYEISEGEIVRQAIRVDVSGDGQSASGKPSSKISELEELDAKFPEIGLAIESGWICGEENTAALKDDRPSFLLLRTGSDAGREFLAESSRLAAELGAPINAEFVLRDESDPAEGLQAIAAMLSDAGIQPEQVMALPQAFLASHQPSGPWPTGMQPQDAAIAARKAFPRLKIGGGMLTNFTEFNRCPPDPSACDYFTYGVTPLVHAADDRSVIETLESYKAIFASGEALCPNLPCRLGLVSIGMRSNPYGAGVADNPAQSRQTMAMYDPRHASLFGAAWIVGAIASTAEHRIEAMTIGAPAGPFGVVSETQPVPRICYDGHPERKVYPMYHVFRSAVRLANCPRVRIRGLGSGLHCFAAKRGGRIEAVVSNLGNSASEFVAPSVESNAVVMDENTFPDAVADRNWIKNCMQNVAGSISLRPFATAFVSFEA